MLQVHALWQPVSGRFKNYIHKPKANGYRSLHDVVTASDGLPMEIQVRCLSRPLQLARAVQACHCCRRSSWGGDFAFSSQVQQRSSASPGSGLAVETLSSCLSDTACASADTLRQNALHQRVRRGCPLALQGGQLAHQ